MQELYILWFHCEFILFPYAIIYLLETSTLSVKKHKNSQ